jgi:hypothetical protein
VQLQQLRSAHDLDLGRLRLSVERQEVKRAEAAGSLRRLLLGGGGNGSGNGKGNGNGRGGGKGRGIKRWRKRAASSTERAQAPQRDWLLLEAHNDDTPKHMIHGDGLIEWRAEGVLKYLLLGPEDPAVEDGWWPPDGEDINKTEFLTACSWQGGGPRSGGASMPKLCTAAACLFNLTADPCEYVDISSDHPDIVSSMSARLANYSTVPPLVGKGCMPQVIDIAGTDGPALQFLPCDVPAAADVGAAAA